MKVTRVVTELLRQLRDGLVTFSLMHLIFCTAYTEGMVLQIQTCLGEMLLTPQGTLKDP